MTCEFLREEATKLAETIIKRCRNVDDYDGGAYVGVAGDGYGVYYAARLLPEKTEQYVKFCNEMVEMQLQSTKVLLCLLIPS